MNSVALRSVASAVLLVAVAASACKRSSEGTKDAGGTPAASASITAASVALPKGTKIDPAATTKVPPIDYLIPKHTLDFAGTVMTMELCRMDASAATIFGTESAVARTPLAAAPDGSLWVLDHERKLRHYVNRSERGCELVLDLAFADHGVLDTTAFGKERFGRVVVDARGVVYLTGDSTRKLEGGKLVEHCFMDWMRTDPTTKLAIGGRTSVTKDGSCDATSATFSGFDPNAPEYANPRAIGFFGDEIVVKGVDMDGTHEITKIGIHAASGAQRVKMGGKEGQDWITSPESATKCGDDLCVYGDWFGTAAISRFTRDGKLVKKVEVKVEGLKDSAMAGAGDGKLWIGGAVAGTFADKTGAKKEGYAGVILLVRPAVEGAPPVSPSFAAALAQPRGDEPAHDGIVGALKGTLRGQPFVPARLAFEYRSGAWRLVVENAHGSHLSTQLMVAPAPGAVSLARAAGPKANTNAFLTTEDNGAEKMSSDMVGSAAHWIAIDRWDVKPYDKNSKRSTQDAGYASGRVWIDMPYDDGKGRHEDSHIAGSFEDAVVTYEDDPAAAK